MPLKKNTGIGNKLDTTPQNALCHTSLTVWQFLVYNQIPATTFSTSPSAEFLVLQSLKTGLKGHCFASVDGIQS